MEKKIVQEAFGEALKLAEEEKKDKIKKIILETLKKKIQLEEEVTGLQKKIKILKKDLEDFKQGRLDLIEERQKVDKLAKETSVVKIIKIIEEHHYPRPWYEPFKFIPCWETPNTTAGTDSNIWTYAESDSANWLNCSGTVFHTNFSGTYEVGNQIFNL